MCINVERNRKFLTHLDVELLYAVLAKETEAHLFRILIMSLENVLLTHPRVARTSRYTTILRAYRNYFSCYIHCFICLTEREITKKLLCRQLFG